MHLRYDIGRDGEWKARSEGTVDATTEQAIDQLKQFALTYPHRLYIDGTLVAEVYRARNGRTVVTQHD